MKKIKKAIQILFEKAIFENSRGIQTNVFKFELINLNDLQQGWAGKYGEEQTTF
jgi:hypothetical protein